MRKTAVGNQDGLSHAFEISIGWKNFDLYAGTLGDRRPIGNARHGIGFSGHKQFPDAGGTRGLDVDIATFQTLTGEHAEQRIICGVLERQRGHGLAFEVGGAVDAAIGMRRQMHERPSAEHGNGLDRYAVGADDQWGVANAATDNGVARAYLLGHVDATTRRLKFNIEPFLLIVAACLGQYPGLERR